jgi:D-arabinitol 4-dehydrogenase
VVADSYAKLREFIVPSIRETLARDEPIDSVAPLPALFLAFLELWQRKQLPFVHTDASLDAEHARRICADADPVGALLADTGLWGELAGDERLLGAVRVARAHLDALAAVRQ